MAMSATNNNRYTGSIFISFPLLADEGRAADSGVVSFKLALIVVSWLMMQTFVVMVAGISKILS